jgi:glucose-6-phosphate isomerase
VREVHDVLDRMAAFATSVRTGEWRGHTGKPIRAVVNIGIGGSDLGPAMAYEALRAYGDRSIAFRFVSNVDATQLVEALRDLDPEETLVIVSSKTFTTVETMTNARSARQWLLDGLGGDERAIARHVVAVSTNLEAVEAFGIDPANAFGFWDWVGGRYSMDSAIGLSTMVAIGPAAFADMLAGFHAVDRHFAETPAERNLPLLMGLLRVWYRDFFGAQTHAVLPYEQYLARFPAYLQQLVMESNGKRVTLEGAAVAVDTAPVVWGEPGTNGQHSFHQLLHQGTVLVPCDLIAFATPLNPLGEHHRLLLANVLAQAQALAFGRTLDELREADVPESLRPHKVMPGNRPSTILLLEQLTPFALGSLVALYEHTVFVAGAIWDIDSFDQWGVELGKELAGALVPVLGGEAPDTSLDASTAALVERLRRPSGRG